jgi:hypothetical protein
LPGFTITALPIMDAADAAGFVPGLLGSLHPERIKAAMVARVKRIMVVPCFVGVNGDRIITLTANPAKRDN